MANIFISYNREDEDKTKALVDDMQELGHTVWFDHELSGGQKWWDTILESVRNCDILVFALSVESLNSSACSLEYDYASKLGKTILPVMVGENVSINLLPPVLSQIQFVEYQKPDRDALLHLAKALTSAPPSQPLPDPLPLPPEVPISYLGKLGKQISNTSKLSYEEQSALLVDLKRGLHDPETSTDTRTLLKKLRKRQYLFENIAREIDELLKSAVQETIVIPNKDEIILSETQKKSQNKTMSSNTKNSRKIILFVSVLLLIAGGATYFYFGQNHQPDKVELLSMTDLLTVKKIDEHKRDKKELAELKHKQDEEECLRTEREKIKKLREEEIRKQSKELARLRHEKAERDKQASTKLTSTPETSKLQSTDSNLKVMYYNGEYYGVRGYTDSKRRSPSDYCKARYTFSAIIKNGSILFYSDGRTFKGSVDGKGNLYIDNRGIRPSLPKFLRITGSLNDAKMTSGFCGDGYFYLQRK